MIVQKSQNFADHLMTAISDRHLNFTLKLELDLIETTFDWLKKKRLPSLIQKKSTPARSGSAPSDHSLLNIRINHAVTPST